MDLANMKCSSQKAEKLSDEEIIKYLDQVNDWKFENNYLVKNIKFPNFKSAVEFVNKVSDLAEKQDHHPNICFTWGLVEIKYWTHTVSGVSIKDFILAAKIDQITKKH